ncbi:MAG: hypothetical protein JXP73_03110 [Deltaproteobacteria bacterium]|nr:hypothetical protein [Deltaproteobacteria bacterium]
MAGTGGVGGFDGGRDGGTTDGPIGSGGSDGAVGSGGAAGDSGGAGGAVVVDAPADQKPAGIVGSPCTLNGDCALGNCIDGVCCATTCAGCNGCASALTGKADGTCAAVLTGQDPHNTCADETATNECGNDGTCDGAGACRKVSTSHVCKAGSCSGTTFTPASTCDGLGACTTPTPENCAPYQCAATGCLKSCTSQTECGATSYCKITSGTTGTCTAKNPNGTPATQGFECTSGIVADGVCCDKACTGCSACSGSPLTAGAAGQCSFVVAGQIAHNACTASGVTCGLDGKCDGAGACRYSPAEGASCDDPANLCVTGRICQNHACTAGTPKICPPPTLQCRGPGTCVPATGSCSYPIDDTLTCTDGNACTTDVCQGGSCVGTQILCNNPPACKQSTTCSGGTCNYTQNVTDGTQDPKCPSTTPRCYSGTCVQCTSDAHCTAAFPTVSCRTTDHTCVCRLPNSKNVVNNGGFDGGLSGWTISTAPTAPTLVADSEGCPGSNALYVPNSEQDPWQCVSLTPGATYWLGGSFKGGDGNGFVRIRFCTGSGCTGSCDTTQDVGAGNPANWTIRYTNFVSPGGYVSGQVGLYGLGNQYMDQIFVTRDENTF